ncbi:MAG: KPN_02809 family neutral zinc metallopeptidase [Thermoanaerobaculia bacterium]
MRWDEGGGVSPDIEDRRGEGGGFGFGGGGFRLGCGGIILLAILSLVFRKNFFALLDSGSGGPPAADVTRSGPPVSQSAEDQQRVKFVSFVIDDVQHTWEKEFPKLGGTYQHAKLVLFRDTTRSGCGFAEAASGPFYCSEDQKVYLDLDFFDELRSRFGVSGEFAEAYVIAHEFGHHVQTLLGTGEKVRRAQEERPSMRNELSVRLELQADCLAGVWGHSTEERNILEKGDVESGLAAAAAVGDDRLQKAATGRVHPETWTHGSSKERTEWFNRGFQSGQVGACDTFASAAR